eukprot:4953360-Amphidinium_carterae.1
MSESDSQMYNESRNQSQAFNCTSCHWNQPKDTSGMNQMIIHSVMRMAISKSWASRVSSQQHKIQCPTSITEEISTATITQQELNSPDKMLNLNFVAPVNINPSGL